MNTKRKSDGNLFYHSKRFGHRNHLQIREIGERLTRRKRKKAEGRSESGGKKRKSHSDFSGGKGGAS